MRCTLRRPATLPCACSARSLAAASLSSQKPSLINPQRLTLTSTSTSLLKNLLSSCRATLFLFLPCIHQRPSASSDRSNASIIVVVVAAITLALHFPDFCPLRKREPTRATSLAAPPSETRDNPFFPGTSPSLSSPTTT